MSTAAFGIASDSCLAHRQDDADLAVSVATTRRWVAKMDELGMTHRYIEIAGGDHVESIARNPAMIAQVFDYFEQSRRSTAAAR